VNDGVMGGVPDGRFRVTERQTLECYGTLSLENNGGFASVFSVRALLLSHINSCSSIENQRRSSRRRCGAQHRHRVGWI